MFLQSLKMAWSSVIGNKMRSFLTMLGIIIGVVALVVLVSIVNGATSSVSDAISSMGTNMLTASITDDKDEPMSLKEMSQILELDGISMAAAYASERLYASCGNESGRAQVTGTSADYLDIEGLELVSGRFLRGTDVDNHTNVAVINQDLALDILGAVHTEDAVGKTFTLGGIHFTVIGVLAKEESVRMSMSSYEAYIPYTTLARVSDSVSAVTSFACAAESDEMLDSAQQNLENWLTARFEGDDEAYTVTNMSAVADTMDSVMNTMAVMLGGIAAISLLVGGIGIMNIMLVSVTERTREIGIRKAIGASNGSILLQFLIEALMVSLMGCILGIGLSWLIIQSVNAIAGYSYEMNKTVVIVATAFSTLTGLIFGLYPARKAAAKKPIDALHYAG